MVSGKGAHGTSRFIRRLRMRRALGIKSHHGMCPASHMRGRECRPGSWWDREKQCVAIEGQDFAQDTEEGGAERFEFIPNSDEEGVHKAASLIGSDDEFVPKMEPQEIVAARKSRPRSGAMFHEWRKIIEDGEQQRARQIAPNEEGDIKASAKEDKEHKDNPKVEKKHEDNTKEEFDQNASFSIGGNDESVPETEPQNIVAARKCLPYFGAKLHEWRKNIEDGEQQCARQIAPNEEGDTKASAAEEKEHKDNPKVENKSEDNTKEEFHQKASFSDLETDDEASWGWVEEVDLCDYSQVEEDSWVQDGEDSHGCSYVETDEFKDKVNELIISLFPAYKDVVCGGPNVRD